MLHNLHVPSILYVEHCAILPVHVAVVPVPESVYPVLHALHILFAEYDLQLVTVPSIHNESVALNSFCILPSLQVVQTFYESYTKQLSLVAPLTHYVSDFLKY